MSFGGTEIVRRFDSGAPLVHQSQEKEREREKCNKIQRPELDFKKFINWNLYSVGFVVRS